MGTFYSFLNMHVNSINAKKNRLNFVLGSQIFTRQNRVKRWPRKDKSQMDIGTQINPGAFPGRLSALPYPQNHLYQEGNWGL